MHTVDEIKTSILVSFGTSLMKYKNMLKNARQKGNYKI